MTQAIILATWVAKMTSQEDQSSRTAWANRETHLQNYHSKKWTEGMAQVVEPPALQSKCKEQSSTPVQPEIEREKERE
jgi:hypothetical protein